MITLTQMVGVDSFRSYLDRIIKIEYCILQSRSLNNTQAHALLPVENNQLKITFKISLKLAQFSYCKIFAMLKRYSNFLLQNKDIFLTQPDIMKLTTGLRGFIKLKTNCSSSTFIHFS